MCSAFGFFVQVTGRFVGVRKPRGRTFLTRVTESQRSFGLLSLLPRAHFVYFGCPQDFSSQPLKACCPRNVFGSFESALCQRPLIGKLGLGARWYWSAPANRFQINVCSG